MKRIKQNRWKVAGKRSSQLYDQPNAISDKEFSLSYFNSNLPDASPLQWPDATHYGPNWANHACPMEWTSVGSSKYEFLNFLEMKTLWVYRVNHITWNEDKTDQYVPSRYMTIHPLWNQPRQNTTVFSYPANINIKSTNDVPALCKCVKWKKKTKFTTLTANLTGLIICRTEQYSGRNTRERKK